jgi:hypothetical protein
MHERFSIRRNVADLATEFAGAAAAHAAAHRPAAMVAA